MNADNHILLVDDDDVFRQRLAKAMMKRGLEVHTARNAVEALEQAEESDFKYAVFDLRMPGEDGLTLLKQFHERKPHTKIVMLSGYGSIATAVQAVKDGAIHFLTKPADCDEILAALSGEPVVQVQTAPSSAPSLDRTEWEHIQRVLTDCEGNISKAARVLGMHRRSLQRKLLKNPPLR